MATSFSCSFDIAAFQAASDRLSTPEQWQAWAQGRLNPDDLPEHKPDVAFLPAMQRRRLGLAARLVFTAAQGLSDKPCPSVFVSHDGEICRSFELWQGLLRDNEVSPTAFGLSVHNALAGQWAMLRGDMSETTALAAQQDGFEIGVLEAVAMLAEGCGQVLLVVADEPIKRGYPVSAQRAPFTYAAAFLLRRGTGWRLQRRLPETAAEGIPPECGYWGALSWLQQHFSGSRRWLNHYEGCDWEWQRTD